MRKFLIRSVVAGAAASSALLGVAGGTAAHACPAQYSNNPQYTYVTVAGQQTPVYTSGAGGAPSVPPNTQNGYVGASVPGQGYVEANGGTGTNPTTDGYIVASNGSAGLLVQGVPPQVPPTC